MAQSEQLLLRIETNYSQFSKTEKKIADYILKQPQSIVHKTIDQIAEELDVAISTVFRFSKTMGYKGFQAMKIALASELANPIREMIEDAQIEKENEQLITEKIFNDNIRMFKETMQVMDFGLMKKAVNLILDANRVEFFGAGNATIVALDAHHKFIGSGINTSAYSDVSLQTRSASQLTENDVAVFISHSGEETDIINIVDIAKNQGAKIIAITNFRNTSLSQKADIVLNTVSAGPEDNSLSRIVQLSLIDSLYANVMSAQKGLLKSSIDKLKSYLGPKQ